MPIEQVSPDVVQSWHARPPVPHWVSISLVTQMSPAQQPDGHVLGPHFGGVGTQLPVAWLQNSPIAVQLVQDRPPVPQSMSLCVGMHVEPEQQPLQLLGPQGALTHVFDEGSHS